MNAKLLVVDDQTDLLELLDMLLSQEGYIVRTAASGEEALAKLKVDLPDLILLDIILGDTSGIKLTTKLKNDIETAHIPIILLTAKDTETDIIVGLSVGADDYITKPFSTKVLLARIDAVLRRAYPDPSAVREILQAGPVRIFPAGRQVFVEGKPVELTPMEFNILLRCSRPAAVRSPASIFRLNSAQSSSPKTSASSMCMLPPCAANWAAAATSSKPSTARATGRRSKSLLWTRLSSIRKYPSPHRCWNSRFPAAAVPADKTSTSSIPASRYRWISPTVRS
jgi:DNA-binding response OmpR family regulator